MGSMEEFTQSSTIPAIGILIVSPLLSKGTKETMKFDLARGSRLILPEGYLHWMRTGKEVIFKVSAKSVCRFSKVAITFTPPHVMP